MAYNNIILADSPINYWRLNEISDGTVTDLGSGSDNGTHVNTPTLNQNGLIFENTGRSADFEASTSEHISLTGNAITDGMNTASAVSFEAWIRVESFTAVNIIIRAIVDGTNIGIQLSTQTNGDIRMQARSVTGDSDQILDVAWNITGVTTQIIGVVDFANGAIYLFQDGTQVGKFSATFANTSYTTGTPSEDDSLLGTAAAGTTFDGRAAELATYSKALTPLEIRQHYQAGIAQGFDKQTLDLTPVLYLPLDEVSGDSLDRVNQNNGVHTSTVQGAVGGLVSSLNKDDKAATFDGATSLITVTDQVAVQDVFDAGGTASIWINPFSDGEGSVGRLFDKSTDTISGWYIQVREEAASKVKLRFYFVGGTTDGHWTTTATEIDINVWSHIVVTYDVAGNLTTNDPTLYVNGVSVGITETQTPSGDGVTDVGDDLIVGNSLDVASTFDGGLQKVGLFTSILTVGQIRTLYQSGIVDLLNRGYDKVIDNLSPVANWRLGEGRGVTIFDDSGNNNDGVTTGSPVFGVTGPIMQDSITGIDFDAVDKTITIVDDAAFNNHFSGGGSISVWVFPRTDGEGGSGAIFGKRDSGNDKGWQLFVSGESAGKVKVRLFQQFTAALVQSNTVNTEVVLDQWNHLVVTYDNGDASNLATIYVDSVSVSMAAGGSGVNPVINDIGADLFIGDTELSTTTFDGVIFGAAFFTSVLTSQQVIQIYEAGVSRFAAEVISKQPLAYWRLNESSGNAINYGSDTTVGTITGATQGDVDTPLTNEVPATTSYNFDGASGDVDFGSPAALDDVFDGGGTAFSFIRPVSTGEANAGKIFDKRDVSGNGFTLGLQTAVPNETLRFVFEFDTTDGTWDTPAGTLIIGGFQFVGVIYDADAASNVPKLYLDSLESIPNSGDVQAVGTRASDAAEILVLGNRVSDDTTFDGEIAESMLFSSILTTIDVLDIYEMAFFLFGFGDNLPEHIFIRQVQQPSFHFIAKLGV